MADERGTALARVFGALDRLFQLALVMLVQGYRVTLAAVLGGRCRYHPSCSVYALQALQTHGGLRGAWLAIRRVSRCHPWGGAGYDPPPAARGVR